MTNKAKTGSSLLTRALLDDNKAAAGQVVISSNRFHSPLANAPLPKPMGRS